MEKEKIEPTLGSSLRAGTRGGSGPGGRAGVLWLRGQCPALASVPGAPGVSSCLVGLGDSSHALWCCFPGL